MASIVEIPQIQDERETPHLKQLRFMKTTLLVSGGAQGSDDLWIKTAHKNGLETQIMSFEGHNCTSASDDTEVVVLDKTQLAQADEYLQQTARRIGRNLPKNDTYVRKLLQRNYAIIKDAEAVFAVGTFSYVKVGLGIEGGTAWGCEMFVSMHVHKPVIQLYFYDLDTRQWFTFTHKWEQCVPPLLRCFRVCAGIGCRSISEDGIKAIERLFEEVDEEGGGEGGE